MMEAVTEGVLLGVELGLAEALMLPVTEGVLEGL